jgi:hypothetical protein
MSPPHEPYLSLRTPTIALFVTLYLKAASFSSCVTTQFAQGILVQATVYQVHPCSIEKSTSNRQLYCPNGGIFSNLGGVETSYAFLLGYKPPIQPWKYNNM